MTASVMTPRACRRPGTLAGIHSGQILATQAAVAGLLAALGSGYSALGAAGLLAGALLAVAWLRFRRRWLHQWLGLAIRYAGRRRTLAPGAGAHALLELANPGARAVDAEVAGVAAAVVEDGYGTTALLELGDPAALLADPAAALPAPASLLPPGCTQGPPVRLRLVISGVPAPALAAGGSSAGTSYRQLTEGRLLGRHRAVLAVQVLRTQGWTEAELRRTLDGAVRRVRRRLKVVGTRLMAAGPALAVLAELAHHDGAQPAHESWHGVRLGGLLQATFRLRRWPHLDEATGGQLVPRLLALPASATTVALSIGPRQAGRDDVAVELSVRLAAPTPAALTVATQSLRRLLSAHGAAVQRLDGEHLAGLTATLPIGGPAPVGPLVVHSGHVVAPDALDALTLPVSGAGLVLGMNRHGEPVSVRLFRSEPTRAMLVGGLRAAQLVTMRSLALGAQVVVQTARPDAWEPFVRGVSVPGGTVAVVPPGRSALALAAPGVPLRPQLVVVDGGPTTTGPVDGGPIDGAVDEPAAAWQGVPAAIGRGVPAAIGPGVPPAAWRAVLVVRDELTPADVDALSRADLAVLQPMGPAEAQLAATALGLGGASEWLTRIRGDMVGVVNRRAVRWALLSATPIEQQLVAR